MPVMPGAITDLATTAGAPPGSGANFAALKARLAARGNVTDPGRLAAWIGRRKYGKAGMARLSHHGSSSHSWPGYDGIALAGSEFEGTTMTCPACGHSGSAASFGASGTSLDKSPDELRTPAPSTGGVRSGAATEVRTGAGGAGLANSGLRSVQLARRMPVTGPMDVMVTRNPDGTAMIRHRQGGTEIARMRKAETGWVATVDGRDMPPQAHQRTSLLGAVSAWNRTATTALRPGMPLQGAPEQTDLMRQYGIPAIRALATPATSAAGGGRVTLAGSDDDGGTDDDGLSPRGQAIKKRLMAKGFPEARATLFAKRAQNTRPGQFGQSAAS